MYIYKYIYGRWPEVARASLPFFLLLLLLSLFSFMNHVCTTSSVMSMISVMISRISIRDVYYY